LVELHCRGRQWTLPYMPKPILDLSDVVRRNSSSYSVSVTISHYQHGSSFCSVALSGPAKRRAIGAGLDRERAHRAKMFANAMRATYSDNVRRVEY
jgi:hypothetical protein